MLEEAEARLIDLAGAIADGRVVDWDALESSTEDPVERARHQRLRAIADVGRAHAEVSFHGPFTLSESFGRTSDQPAVAGRPDVGLAADSREGRARPLRRCVSSVGPEPRSRSGAEAPPRRRSRARTRCSSKKAASWPGSVIPTSSRSTAPSGSTGGPDCGWSSSAGARSKRNCASAVRSRRTNLVSIGIELCRALTAVHEAGLRPPRRQSAERDARFAGARPARRLRHGPGAGGGSVGNARDCRHTRLPGARNLPSRACDSAKRHLQPWCAAVSSGHRRVPRSGTLAD